MSDRRRGTAWLALIAAALALAALLSLVVRNVTTLLFTLGALALAGGAGWIAVTRRGVARTAAAACAVGAVAGGGVALVALGAVDELIVLAAAAVVFTVTARQALRRERRATRDRGPRRSHRRGVLLVNPMSGGGKAAKFALAAEARRRGIDPVVLNPGDDLRTLAQTAARTADVLGMAGGDGSLALVAQVAMEHDIGFVCIPAGTRNHLALDLGVDRHDVLGALDAFAGGLERRVDLAFVNERAFVNNVSLGVYAQIVQTDAYRDAKLETFDRMLPDLLGPDAPPFDLRFAGPDGGARQSAQLILVSNNPYVLDRLAGAGSRPRLDTGKLGIVAVEIAGAAKAAKLVSLDALGQIRRFEGWLEWAAEEFEVDSSAPVAAGVDGEATILEPPLRFTITPAALSVLLPPTSEGLSPAALTPALGREALRDLWDTATTRR